MANRAACLVTILSMLSFHWPGWRHKVRIRNIERPLRRILGRVYWDDFEFVMDPERQIVAFRVNAENTTGRIIQGATGFLRSERTAKVFELLTFDEHHRLRNLDEVDIPKRAAFVVIASLTDKVFRQTAPISDVISRVDFENQFDDLTLVFKYGKRREMVNFSERQLRERLIAKLGPLPGRAPRTPVGN